MGSSVYISGRRRLSTCSYRVSEGRLRTLLIVARKSRTHLVFTAVVLHLRVACTQTSGQFSHWAAEPRQNSARGFSVQDRCANSGKGHVKIIPRRQDHADRAPMTGSKSNSEVVLRKAPSSRRGKVSAKRGGEWKYTTSCSMRCSPVDGKLDSTPTRVVGPHRQVSARVER